jgi:iron complex outermembrane receptor protein
VGNNGASYTTGSFIPHDEDNTSLMAGLNGKFNTGAVSHKLNFGLSGLWAEQRSAYDFDLTQYANNIYHPVETPSPVGNFSGGDLNDPGIVGKTFNRSLALSDTLGFFDDRLLITAGLRRQQLVVQGYNYASYGSGSRKSSYDESITTRSTASSSSHGSTCRSTPTTSKVWRKARLRRPAPAACA